MNIVKFGIVWICATILFGISSASADVQGQTFVYQGSVEPGDTFVTGAYAVEPSTFYVLRVSTSAEGCATGRQIGGSVLSNQNGIIRPVVRTMPVSSTSGARYVCWLSEDGIASAPARIVVV